MAGAQSVSRGVGASCGYPSHAVELDVFHGDRECVVLRVGRIERDLGGLDLADDVEGSIVLADAKRALCVSSKK